MAKAVYKGKVKDRNGYAIHLFYHDEGYTYGSISCWHYGEANEDENGWWDLTM